MGDLKSALLKAGFKASKSENERQKREPWLKAKKSVLHQEQRNYCEVCETIQPDVERYKHRNPTVEAEWICVSCADKNLIDDKFRVTTQSDFSKKNIFRREYGQTMTSVQSGGYSQRGGRDVNGNKQQRPQGGKRKKY